MKVKVLNERQAQWAVKLVTFNFVIMHWSDKTNSADVSLRHSDYCQNMSESIELLLLSQYGSELMSCLLNIYTDSLNMSIDSLDPLSSTVAD